MLGTETAGCTGAYPGGRSVFNGDSWADLQEVIDGLDYPCYKLKEEPD